MGQGTTFYSFVVIMVNSRQVFHYLSVYVIDVYRVPHSSFTMLSSALGVMRSSLSHPWTC